MSQTPTLASLTPLQRAVIRRMGGGREAIETAIEAGRHGADAGWPGFTYYTDTVSFYKRHRSDIMDMLAEMADSMGETPSAVLAGFRCLRDAGIDDPMAVLANPRSDDYTTVANALAWFALEETGRALDA